MYDPSNNNSVPASTKPEVSSNTKETDAKISLRQCFSTIVDRKPLFLSKSDLYRILAADLNISLQTLHPGMENVLAEAIAFYMKVWPGWSQSTQYFKGQLQFKKWFEKFQQYLVFKASYIIKKAGEKYNSKCSVVPTKSKDVTSIAVQTDLCDIDKEVINKPDASYQLCISAPPSILNSLVFVKDNNNVLIKQHSERNWTYIDVGQLLNWPYAGVDLKLLDLMLTRNTLLECKRYIGLTGDIKQEPPMNIDLQVKQMDDNNEVYDFKYVSAYIEQLLKTIDSCRTLGLVSTERYELLDVFFRHYLEDIKEANVHKATVCTNTLVTYQIGKSIYFRNKRIVTSGANNSEVINFFEFFAPKVQYAFGRFPAIEDGHSVGVSFKSLNKIDILIEDRKIKELEGFVSAVNTCLVLRCNMCNKCFTGSSVKLSFLSHLRKSHKLEQAVLCFKCRRQYDILLLTETRWKHKCVDS